MNLEEKINQAIKAAMLAKEAEKLQALRAVKAAILLEKTSESKSEVTEEIEVKLLQRLIKQRRDSAAVYEQNKRSELAQQETFEADVIAEFLPQQLTQIELLDIVQQIAREHSITTSKEMGKLIGLVNKSVSGRADGKVIADTVKKHLDSLS